MQSSEMKMFFRCGVDVESKVQDLTLPEALPVVVPKRVFQPARTVRYGEGEINTRENTRWGWREEEDGGGREGGG